jgi:hypothetical protein
MLKYLNVSLEELDHVDLVVELGVPKQFLTLADLEIAKPGLMGTNTKYLAYSAFLRGPFCFSRKCLVPLVSVYWWISGKHSLRTSSRFLSSSCVDTLGSAISKAIMLSFLRYVRRCT